MILYKLCTVWLLNLLCAYVCEVTACMCVILTIKRHTIPAGTGVTGCTDLSGKELYRQVGLGIVGTSGSLRGIMVACWPKMPEVWI